MAKWAELFHFDECVAAPRVIVEAAFGKGTHVACGSLPGCVIFFFCVGPVKWFRFFFCLFLMFSFFIPTDKI